MRRRDSKLTISNALIFYLFMGIVLPVCLFGMCFTLVMNHTLRKNAHEAAEQAVETSAVQVDNLISGISYTASYIIGSSDVLEKVQTIEADPTSADAMWAREYLIKCVRSLGNIALYAYNPDVSIITTNGIVVGVDYIHYLDQEDVDELFALPVFDDSFSVWHEPQSDVVTADLVSYWTIRTRGEIAALLRETYGSKIKVFSTEIPHSVRAKEISAEGKSIFAHDPGGKVAESYKNLTQEVTKLEKQREKSRAGIGR